MGPTRMRDVRIRAMKLIRGSDGFLATTGWLGILCGSGFVGAFEADSDRFRWNPSFLARRARVPPITIGCHRILHVAFIESVVGVVVLRVTAEQPDQVECFVSSHSWTGQAGVVEILEDAGFRRVDNPLVGDEFAMARPGVTVSWR